MKTITLAMAALAVAVCPAACNDRARDHAITGAMPGVATPVGPIPGPGVAPAATASPFKASPELLVEGRQLFVQFNCAGCHGGRAGGGMGPSLRDEDWLYGNADIKIFDSIVEGRGHGMPAWGFKLTEDQAWKIVAYIRSLRTELEPEKPQ